MLVPIMTQEVLPSHPLESTVIRIPFRRMPCVPGFENKNDITLLKDNKSY